MVIMHHILTFKQYELKTRVKCKIIAINECNKLY